MVIAPAFNQLRDYGILRTAVADSGHHCLFHGNVMENLISLIQQFWADIQSGRLPQLGPWNYIVLSILIIWQGPIATLLGGAAAAAGLLQPGLVFLSGVIGNLVADILWYAVGRRGNAENLFGEKGRLRSHRTLFYRLRKAMRYHATKILLMAKLSAGFAVPALLAAGLTRLRWRKWFPVVFVGETIWTGSLVLIGFYATEALKQVEQGLQLFAAALSFLFLLAIVWYIPRLLRDSDALRLPPAEDNNSSS